MTEKIGIEPTHAHFAFGSRRVSSLKQSYERQTKALHDSGIADDWIYEDKISGKFKNRSGLDALLKVDRHGDTITVTSLDRLGRTVLHILQTIEELEHRGIFVQSLKPGGQFECQALGLVEVRLDPFHRCDGRGGAVQEFVLNLDWWAVADLAVEPAVVEPVDVFDRRDLSGR